VNSSSYKWCRTMFTSHDPVFYWRILLITNQ